MAKSDYGKKPRSGYDKKFAEGWDKIKGFPLNNDPVFIMNYIGDDTKSFIGGRSIILKK